MTESRLTYDQFKADIFRWKNSHREEYNRFARLMTNGDERQYLAICRAIFKQLPKAESVFLDGVTASPAARALCVKISVPAIAPTTTNFFFICHTSLRNTFSFYLPELPFG